VSTSDGGAGTGLRWLLATLVAGALSFALIAIVLHGGADPSARAEPIADDICAPARTPIGTQQVLDGTVSVGDITRTYRLTLPSTYSGTERIPLVLLFHGTSGTIDDIESYTGMVTAAAQRGYATLTPQAISAAPDGTLPTAWTVPGFDGEGAPDDVAFVSGLIDTVTTAYCVDPDRVFATGLSSGAAFSTYLACRTDLLAGIAPVAGMNLVEPCPNADPLTVVTFHGTADALVAYEGLTYEPDPDTPDTGFYNGPIQEDVSRWAAAFGCDQTLDEQPAADVTTRTYSGCRDGVSVTVVTVAEGGHQWPGGSYVREELGYQTDSITATSVMLDAFDAAPGRTATADQVTATS
jgi:polyhydroxybutyrate depolymerase